MRKSSLRAIVSGLVMGSVSLVPADSPLAADWWNSGYGKRVRLTVNAGSDALPAGYSVFLVLDHAALVSAGQSLASGNDVRLVHWNGAGNVEVDRLLEPNTAWNGGANQIWFKLQAGIAASGTDTNYWLYYQYSGAGAPPVNGTNVFILWDGFDGSSLDASVWDDINTGVSGSSVTVGNGQLTIKSQNNWWDGSEASRYIVWKTGFPYDYLVDTKVDQFLGASPSYDRFFGVRAGTAAANYMYVILADGGADNLSTAYRDAANPSTSWAGDNAGPAFVNGNRLGFRRQGGTLRALYNGNAFHTNTAAWLTNAHFVALADTADNNTVFDWVRLRRYVASDGAISVSQGAVESGTPSAPEAPVATPASAILQTSFTANWNSSVGATNYLLDVATDGGFGAYVDTYSNCSAGNVTSASVTGLTENTTYYYRVRAESAGGASSNSNVITTNTLTPAPPAAPAATAATNLTRTSFYANWTASANATNYFLDVATDSGFTAMLSGYSNRVAGNVTTHFVTGLTPGAPYYYRVRAENTYGVSSNSNTIATNMPPRGWTVVNVDLGMGGGYAGTAGVADHGTFWNAIASVGNHTGLQDSYGANTGLGLQVPGGGNASMNPATSRAGNGSPCAELMEDFWRTWNEERTFTVFGLHPAGIYDLYLYAAADTVNNGPDYGCQAFILNGTTNVTTGTTGVHALTQGIDYVAFTNVTPDVSSQIVFTVTLKSLKSSFLNGLQIVERFPPPRGTIFKVK